MAVFKIGKIFYVDFYANGRRIRYRIGTNRKIAEAVFKKKTLEALEGKFLDVRKERKVKFEDFAQGYLSGHAAKKKSYHSDVDTIKRLNKFFGGKFLHEITRKMIEGFQIERAKEVSGATINRNLACLKCIFNKAIEWGDFSGKNPVKGIKFFKEQQRQRFLLQEEILKLLENCNEHLKPIIIVALNTGMRKGEILNLKWRDVDFKRDIIYLYQTKSGEKREAPMNAEVKSALIKVSKHPESPYIFCNKDGKPYGDVKKSFFTVCKNAGIIKNSKKDVNNSQKDSDTTKDSNFRFHDLRHTFASHLVMNGVDLNTVRELLGHKDIKMTLRYSHLSPDHKKRAVDLLGRRINIVKGIVKNQEKAETAQNFDFNNSLLNKELVDIQGP